jgi:hypothetical protein
MATNLEYALMAGVAYRSTRNEINRFPIPTSSGWSEILGSHRNLDASGFEAIAFQNGTDIVISYAGTNGDGGGISTNPDKQASIVLALGTGSAQLVQAAEYYLKVKAANTVNGVAPNIGSKGSGSDYFLCWLLMSRYPASMLMVSPPPCPVGQVTTCGKQFWAPFRFCRCNNIGLLSYIF